MIKTLMFYFLIIVFFISCSVVKRSKSVSNNFYPSVDLFGLPIYKDDSSKKMDNFFLAANQIKDSIIDIGVFYNKQQPKRPSFNLHYFPFEKYPAFFSVTYVLLGCVANDTIVIEQEKTIYVSHTCNNAKSIMIFDMTGEDSVKVTRFFF